MSASSVPDNVLDSLLPETQTHRQYGWGRIRPSWLQWLNRPGCFLALLSLCAVAQSMVVNGLISVSVSTLETRYTLTSVQAGWILSTYELAGIPSLILIALAGSELHRPRWVALGMLLVSLGSLLFCLPHFISGSYTYSENVTDFLCQQQSSNASMECAADVEHSDLSNYLWLFLLAVVLLALGAVPIYVLGIPYLDDALSKEDSTLYIGILYTSAVVGPAIAFILGGLILNSFYIDVDNLNLKLDAVTSDDPRWLGAWWVGFLFASCLLLLVVVPLLGYPPHLPVKDFSDSKTEEVQSVEGVDAALQPGFGASYRDLPKSLKILFYNPTFVFSCLYGACDGLVGSGFNTFGPKYIENQFGLTAGMASVIFGVVAIPGGAGGYLLGSYLTKRLSLSCKQLLQLMVIGGLLCPLFVSIFFIKCDNTRFAGVTNHYSGSQQLSGDIFLGAPCNSGCGCESWEDSYQPVCGSDGYSYFSPCFAGCAARRPEVDDNHIILALEPSFVNCSCVSSSSPAVSAGLCPVEGCNLLPLFATLFFSALFIFFACGIFHVSVIIRCVPSAQKSLALSIDWLGLRILGSMPGPLLFGVILDQSCLLWGKNCRESGSCLYYDNHNMAWYMMAICVPAKVLGILLGILAWRLYKPRQTAEVSSDYNITNINTDYGTRDLSSK